MACASMCSVQQQQSSELNFNSVVSTAHYYIHRNNNINQLDHNLLDDPLAVISIFKICIMIGSVLWLGIW